MFLLLFYYIVFELNCIPHPFQIHMVKSYPSTLDVILFGDRFFTEVINLK